MNYPALIKSYSGTIYHITDNGCKTRCGRSIDALPESHALALDDDERCPKCGSYTDFSKISDTRRAEEVEAHRAHLDKLAEIAAVHAAQCAARPKLVSNIITALDIGPIVDYKTYRNMDELRVPVTIDGQRFTVKIEVWNGDHQ